MSFYTMSDHPINVPEMNSIDALAEQRELRDQRIRANMDRKAYIEAILDSLRDAMEEHGHPLEELTEMLFEAPIRDQFDARAFLDMRDGRRLGKAIIALLADVSLEAYQEADVEGF